MKDHHRDFDHKLVMSLQKAVNMVLGFKKFCLSLLICCISIVVFLSSAHSSKTAAFAQMF